MASAVAAAFILIWRSGIAARLACLPLVATQIAWGGDSYFYPTHAMIHQSPIKAVTDLMSAYFRNDTRRLLPFGGWLDAGNSLPKRSKVLVHHSHVHLGLQAMTVSDWAGWQGGLSYAALGSPRAIYDELARWHVTHVLWDSEARSESLADDLAFWRFAKLWTVDARSFRDGITVVRMLPSPPSGHFSDAVLVRVCGALPYADGVYNLSDLSLHDANDTKSHAPIMRLEGAVPRPEIDTAQSAAGLFVLRPACDPTLTSRARSTLRAIGAFGDVELFARPPAP
jgi:hypothetical protein